MTSAQSTLRYRRRDFPGMVREMYAWNRSQLDQGRVRAFLCAWRDVRGVLYGKDLR